MAIDINEILNEQDKEMAPEAVDLLNQKFSFEKAELSRKTLVDMRRRIAAGECIDADELANALSLIREMYGREAMVAKAKAMTEKVAVKRKPAVKKVAPKKIDVDALLGDILGDL